MRRATRSLLATTFALASAGCGAYGAEVTIPQQQLPGSFEGPAPGQSIAGVGWRAYFADKQLTSLIQSAVTANADLHIALQRIEVVRAGVRQATGALLPQVSMVAGVGIQKWGRYTAEGAGNVGTEITPGRAVPNPLADFAVGFQSTWEIDAWGKLRNERQSAVARYLATIEGANLVLTGLIADVASAYFELLALDHSRDLLTQTVVGQEEALEVVRVQKLAGRANELAVQQFAAQVLGTKALLAETELRVRETENRINLLRGAYPQPVARAKAELLRDLAPSVAAGLPAELLKNRPDIREAELEVQAAKCDLSAARAAFFPSLNISAGVGFQAFNPKFLLTTPESLVYSATAGLVAPLLNRSGIEAQFDAAKAAQIQVMYNYLKVVLNAYAEVANGLASLANSSKIVALKKEQKAAIEQTVATADTLYRAGKASYFEVLIAQQNTLSTELDLIQAMRDQHLASILIYKALGGGWR